MKFTYDQLGIVRVSCLSCGNDLEEGYTCTIVVNQHLAFPDETLGSLLLHLDAFDQDMVLILLVVIEEKAAVKHDWVVLLSDLISLWEVSVHIVFPVELDLGKDASSEGKRRLDSLVEALFVKDGEHARQAQIHKVRVGVRIHACRVERSWNRVAQSGRRLEKILNIH